MPTTTTKTTVHNKVVAMHWFRKGLRLHDNLALMSCLRQQKPQQVYPVYILDGDCYQLQKCTCLKANFLLESLHDLDINLRKLGTRLYVQTGDPCVVIPELWKAWGVTYMSYEQDETEEPYAYKRDMTICQLAKQQNIEIECIAQETLYPLHAYLSKCSDSNNPPTTMNGFQKLFANMGPLAKPLDAPTKNDFPPNTNMLPDNEYMVPKRLTELPWPRSIPKEHVTPIWGPNDCKNLTPIVHGGESHALELLKEKMSDINWVATFEKPKTSCTSVKKSPSTTSLSPYLSLGCLSPRTFWYAIQEACQKSNSTTSKSKPPVSLHGQLLWRDFNNLMAKSANMEYPGSWGQMVNNRYCRQVPWSDNPELLDAWKNGSTGYPWIDACMMQLKQEGWIHHLGRHAVACFLTRGDLWQSWEKGAEHFESHLLDADYSLNGFNWLWLSCSGFFYQYFRCYSPIVFQKKNDPSGQYIRKYIPILAKLPDKYIYEPWKAPIAVQKEAGIRIGQDYPKPIVDHSVVSKENMSKMSYAYDQHKEKEKATSSSSKKKTKSAPSVAAAARNDGGSSSGGGPRKKKMKQTKLK